MKAILVRLALLVVFACIGGLFYGAFLLCGIIWSATNGSFWLVPFGSIAWFLWGASAVGGTIAFFGMMSNPSMDN